ncbi:hypothetical protein Ancab_000209 [Ancistrocladus abbreviatus]
MEYRLPNFMNPLSLSAELKPKILLSSIKIRFLCKTTLNLNDTHELIQAPSNKRTVSRNGTIARVSVSDAELKENWLSSLSCPFTSEFGHLGIKDEVPSIDSGSKWIIGVDPDVSGALALLKSDHLGCNAQVFDSPHLKVLVGRRVRRRLDAKSIARLVRSFEAPFGTTAYIEQSLPYPQDGNRGRVGGVEALIMGYGLVSWLLLDSLLFLCHLFFGRMHLNLLEAA